MAEKFNAASFMTRWIFAIILVLGSYNPSGHSYIGWVLDELTEFGPLMAISGLILLIAWIIYLRATLLSIGWLGVTLGAALFAAIIWLLVDIGLLSIESTGIISYLVLLLLSLILATGMSWSHIRRRMTGQIDVDEIEG